MGATLYPAANALQIRNVVGIADQIMWHALDTHERTPPRSCGSCKKAGCPASPYVGGWHGVLFRKSRGHGMTWKLNFNSSGIVLAGEVRG